MAIAPERSLFTVGLHNGLWAVEHDGQYFDHSQDKEVAKAAAIKRARRAQEGGILCKVKVNGE
jgi:hypothetical protein